MKLKIFFILMLLILPIKSLADIAIIVSGEVGNKANIRSGPQIKSSIIGQVKKGDAYRVVDKEGDWYQIKVGDKNGWIHKALIRIDKEKATVMPPPPPPPVKKTEKEPEREKPAPEVPAVKKPEKKSAGVKTPPPTVEKKKEEEKEEAEEKPAPKPPVKKTDKVTFQEDMIFIPAGEFLMGSNEESKGDNDEVPQHKVFLDAYFINKYEVTNKDFERFTRQTNYKTEAEKIGKSWVWKDEWQEVIGANWLHPQGPQSNVSEIMNHPVVQVSWNDVQEYCRFMKKRMPTEAEWEKAARGKENYVYPWGNTWDPNLSNFFKKGSASGTLPVGSFPRGASSYGVMDMAGNVAEWVSDWYEETYYQKSPANNPPGGASGILKVIRGGSWLNTDPFYLRTFDRTGAIPESSWVYLGFRCAAGTQ